MHVSIAIGFVGSNIQMFDNTVLLEHVAWYLLSLYLLV